MSLRSLLFVPGDRPERMEKARHSGADALILDLEDSVAPGRKAAARQATAEFLRNTDRRIRMFVRINPLDTSLARDDLSAILGVSPDGIVLPKAEGAQSVASLASIAPGLPILPIATETPKSIFALGTYAEVSQHLLGLTWGAEDLPAAIGAATSREEDGRYTAPYEMARSLTLFAAHAADVAAIETVFPLFRDLDGLAAYAARARRDGFTGMMAIHPSQVAVINTTFSPSDVEIAQAETIIAAFDANPGAGALQINGRMIDAPHLKQARLILGRAATWNRKVS